MLTNPSTEKSVVQEAERLASDCLLFADSAERMGTPWGIGCANVLRLAATALAEQQRLEAENRSLREQLQEMETDLRAKRSAIRKALLGDEPDPLRLTTVGLAESLRTQLATERQRRAQVEQALRALVPKEGPFVEVHDDSMCFWCSQWCYEPHDDNCPYIAALKALEDSHV